MKLAVFVIFFLVSPTGFAAIGDWVGYDGIESRVRLRLFQDRPTCQPPETTFDEYQSLIDRETQLSFPEWTRLQQLKGELAIKPGFVLGGVIGDFQPRSTNFAHLLGSRFQPANEAFLMESSHGVNALNTLAWEVTLKNLASRLGAVCAQVGRGDPLLTLSLSDTTLSIPQCRSRAVPLRTEVSDLLRRLCQPGRIVRETAEELFLLATGYDEPEEEQDSWLAEVTKPEYDRLPPGERVELMFRTIFLNPYFLLQQ